MTLRSVPQWDGGTPEYDVWDYPSFRADGNWNAATGPQDFSRAPRANDSWSYLSAAIDPGAKVGFGVRGVTYLCNESLNVMCDWQVRSIDIQWSDIYFDPAITNESMSLTKRVTLAAHEMGHAIGLYHHPDQRALMFPDVDGNGDLQGPQSIEFGSTTDCRGAVTVPIDQRGLRCVYGWYETPTPSPTRAPVPTATNTPTPSGGGGGGGGK